MNDLLVSTEWLEANLKNPDLRIVDIRGQVITTAEEEGDHQSHYEDYVAEHIPGAVFIDWINEICDDPQHLRLADPEKFSRAMSRIGITPDTLVIAYDNINSILAARLWWSLSYYGHEKTAVLDGGWGKWQREGRPVTMEMPSIEATEFRVQPVNRALRRQGDEVLRALNSSAAILDVRTQAEFRGEISMADINGHIPGAVSLPAESLVTGDDGTLLSPNQLRELFAQAGIDGSEPEVIIYSNTGMAACLALLALRAAGLENGSVYDTSWLEWGNDARKPVAQV